MFIYWYFPYYISKNFLWVSFKLLFCDFLFISDFWFISSYNNSIESSTLYNYFFAVKHQCVYDFDNKLKYHDNKISICNIIKHKGLYMHR